MRRIELSYSFSNLFNPQMKSSTDPKLQVPVLQTQMREHPIQYILSKNVSWPSPPQGAMITCNCGRAPGHRYKEGTIFTNSLILGKLASFLHKTDIFSLKIAFSNYHSVENFLHNLSCKENTWDMHCDCRHRSLIVTIWPQKQKISKTITENTKYHKKIQKNTKNHKKKSKTTVFPPSGWVGPTFTGCNLLPAHQQFNLWSYHYNAIIIATTCKEELQCAENCHPKNTLKDERTNRQINDAHW